MYIVFSFQNRHIFLYGELDQSCLCVQHKFIEREKEMAGVPCYVD